ncbi:sulfatase-like hydrolase/transferase [Flavobacterium azooxidireducens]|uniref:Sulfatase-like hydrolase/transferase n=1 Tax=Flavobacterium azooxidireducens TaxID=1871076 RepID=A0ABY4KC46_9FLAO|nr:sulfatase-like hydrolase/transferase [Flavobacterium azooxidireducens]UPQ78354.1 sulfatase-like hydrolase/transferase [Flavobacterium azooxidireducens]
MKDKIVNVLKKDSVLPLIAALASGMYPWAFYFTNNFDFVNSWDHFFFFISRFILLPMVVFYGVYFLLKSKYLRLFKTTVLPFLSGFVFFYLVMLALHATVGFNKIIIVFVLAVLVAIACRNIQQLFKKLLIIQFILVLTTGLGFYRISKSFFKYSDEWIEQPDNIEEVIFKKTPNIYVIQPDGYANFSELRKGYYKYDNSTFESWLETNNFKLYHSFRSNYFSTLSSNSSLFSMKHHYNNLFDERKIIMDKNTVVSIFKNNGYKTHFLAELPYLLINRPNIKFDYTNFDVNNISFLSKGLEAERSILVDLPLVLQKNKEENGKNFYFIEKLLPGHITTFKDATTTKEKERLLYLKSIEDVNEWMKNVFQLISENDPNAMIIILADHGGFVGWDYTLQTTNTTSDENLINSVFTAALAIKWPNNEPPTFKHEFKSSVNFFRTIFSYLAEDEIYLKNLQDDASYLTLWDEKNKGLYKVINSENEIVLEKNNSE